MRACGLGSPVCRFQSWRGVQVIAASGDLGVVRLGRLLRAVRILRALRLMRIGLFFWRGMDHLSTTLDVRLL